MPFSISRWRPGHLLAAWSAYWLGLAAVTLTPIVTAIVRATSGGTSGTGNASVNFGDGNIGIAVSRAGKTLIERSAGVLPIALWIAVPPLVLWGAWLYARSRALSPSAGRVALGRSTPEALGAPPPDAGLRAKESIGVGRPNDA